MLLLVVPIPLPSGINTYDLMYQMTPVSIVSFDTSNLTHYLKLWKNLGFYCQFIIRMCATQLKIPTFDLMQLIRQLLANIVIRLRRLRQGVDQGVRRRRRRYQGAGGGHLVRQVRHGGRSREGRLPDVGAQEVFHGAHRRDAAPGSPENLCDVRRRR